MLLCDSWGKEGPGREHRISGKGSHLLSEIQGGNGQKQGSGQKLPSLKVLKGKVVASLATKNNRGWALAYLVVVSPSLLFTANQPPAPSRTSGFQGLERHGITVPILEQPSLIGHFVFNVK